MKDSGLVLFARGTALILVSLAVLWILRVHGVALDEAEEGPRVPNAATIAAGVAETLAVEPEQCCAECSCGGACLCGAVQDAAGTQRAVGPGGLAP